MRPTIPCAPPALARRALRAAALALAALAALPLALLAGGCADAGGGSSSSAGSGGAVTGAGTGSGTGAIGTGTGPGGAAASNARQAQLAQTAQALPAPLPHLDPRSIQAFDDLIRAGWPGITTLVRTEVDTRLRAAVGQALSGVRIVSVRSVALDANAPPRLSISPPNPASPRQTLFVEAPPAPDGWALHASFDVGGTIPFTIAGIQTGVTILMAVDVDVTDIRVAETGVIDLTNPLVPAITGWGAPQASFRLRLSSQDPLLSTIASTLTQVLDPIVRVALAAGSIVAWQQIGVALGNMPNSSGWGKGGPALPSPAGSPDLEAVAEGLSDKVRHFMSPFGHVYPTEYDQPDAGGNVVDYAHHGDSALWTGGWLTAECLRWDLTRDPRALDAARHALEGIAVLSEVVPAPYEGLLARAAVPTWSPFAGRVSQGQTSFQGSARGETYWCKGDTSRDSYTGVTTGLGQAVIRLPPAERAVAGRVIGRLVDHLEGRGWTVFQAPGQPSNPQPGQPRMSVTAIQSPALVLAMMTVAATADPARYGPRRVPYAPLADMLWLNGWLSAQEVHEAYFKFNLENMSLLTLQSHETDPAAYRSEIRLHETLRQTIAHHQNPYFDSIYAAGVPAAGPALSGDVRHQLEKWTQRKRRGWGQRLSQDPTIPKATYTTSVPNATGAPSSGFQTGPRSQVVALFCVPVELRPPTAFLWSSSPFELDGWEDPKIENPGVDLMLPYWIARSYGVIAR